MHDDIDRILIPQQQIASRVGELARQIMADWLPSKPTINNGDEITLVPILTGACFDDVLGLLPRAFVGSAPASLPYSALCIPPWYKGLPIPVRRMAKLVRQRGVPTHVWTVNDPSVAQSLWSAGINGIISDDPETMLAVRRAL